MCVVGLREFSVVSGQQSVDEDMRHACHQQKQHYHGLLALFSGYKTEIENAGHKFEQLIKNHGKL